MTNEQFNPTCERVTQCPNCARETLHREVIFTEACVGHKHYHAGLRCDACDLVTTHGGDLYVFIPEDMLKHKGILMPRVKDYLQLDLPFGNK